jgi:hypothetical protein
MDMTHCDRNHRKLQEQMEQSQEQFNQMMAMMKQRVEEGRNPVTGLPLPARR